MPSDRELQYQLTMSRLGNRQLQPAHTPDPMAGATDPISAITGKPEPTDEERFAGGKAIGNYFKNNALGPEFYKSRTADLLGIQGIQEPVKEYAWDKRKSGREEPGIYATPPDRMLLGEVTGPVGGLEKVASKGIRAATKTIGKYSDETLHIVGSRNDVHTKLADDIAFNLGAVKTKKVPHHRTPHRAYFKTREEAEAYKAQIGTSADFISAETRGVIDTPGKLFGTREGTHGPGTKVPVGVREPISAGFKSGKGFEQIELPRGHTITKGNTRQTVPELNFENLNPDQLKKIEPFATSTDYKFGDALSEESNGIYKWYKNHTGESAIHANQKTGMSIDFSTSCPKRLDNLTGPCPYCYVEHGRVADKLYNMKGNVKGVFEQPYRNEVMQWPDDLIAELNRDGGIRMFSFGDYRPKEDFKNVEMLLADAKARGLNVKAITKQPEFVKDWGDHPNLSMNISIDNVPRFISKNAPTRSQAIKLKAGRDNIQIRSVALNPADAEKFGRDPAVDVVTLYHGLTNFSTSKWGYYRSGENYDEVLGFFQKNGLAKTQQQYPQWDIKHYSGPGGKKAGGLTKAEIDKGVEFRLDVGYENTPTGRRNANGEKLWRHDKLFKIVADQNPELIKRVGEKKVKKFLDTWVNMNPESQIARKYQGKYAKKVCCKTGKCPSCSVNCGKGSCGALGALLIPGVLLPEDDGDNE